ncbi:protein aurora borealis isoform X1 [Silurus asotus]|uniref:Protein aurora borealis n=1 Tax=Silurus asotus TaxID=30991 RepID=A0AAD5FUP5_SILAS|nr:protein aurora borealis isoform X1 [Silurus asotus]
MGDVAEIQITPETPGRPAILNPFESPTDYHRLHESLVPSPSVFKSSRVSSATPAKFKWSIDEMASLLPVHIDPEDIHRQALFMSQTRMDADVEQKRQSAIEQFFTKGAIVPSPWGPLASKQSALLSHEKITGSSSSRVTEEQPAAKKIHATCQTILSLPVDFDIEKVLGDYYRTDEVSEQVQESLSSSSLRRKLFLDGHASGSDSSSPPSPEREAHGASREMMSSVIVSPVNCGTTATTPSSGQFSSSPIQERDRAYSLGSVASPMFAERSPLMFKSPTLSPIVQQHSVTPQSGERKRLSFLSPDGLPSCSQNMAVSGCGKSPYVEGCSPIRSSSPLHPHHSSISSFVLQTHLQVEEHMFLGEPLPTMELDSCSPRVRAGHGESQTSLPEYDIMEQSKPTEEELGRLSPHPFSEEEDEEEEAVANREEFCRLSSSRTGSLSNAESTRMFVSLLAERSMAPYDVSMQVDSGYNTYSTCTTSLMDGVSADSQSKEAQDTHNAEEGLTHSKHTKSKHKSCVSA